MLLLDGIFLLIAAYIYCGNCFASSKGMEQS